MKTFASETGLEATAAATEGEHVLKRVHRAFAPRAVDCILSYRVWERPKQYPAVFHKLLWNIRLFRFALKFAALFFKAAIFFLQVFEFLRDRLQLVAEKRYPFILDGSAGQSVEHRKNFSESHRASSSSH